MPSVTPNFLLFDLDQNAALSTVFEKAFVSRSDRLTALPFLLGCSMAFEKVVLVILYPEASKIVASLLSVAGSLVSGTTIKTR